MEHRILERMDLGKSKYGHGVRVDDNTKSWGTRKNSWMEMAEEEFLDAIIYVAADYIRQGRNSKDGMSILEQIYDARYNDDNGLIMYVVKNVEFMDSNKHKFLLKGLLEFCK